MSRLTLMAVLLASTLTACATEGPRVTSNRATEPPATTTALPIKTPPGLTSANPATLHTPVDHPYLTITLVGLGLPAGFPVVTPDPGQRFVAPQLTFFCRLPPDSSCERIGSFELIDAQGTRHSPSITISGEGFLSTEPIPGGTTMTGGLVFMVPLEATPMTLRYIDRGREAFFRIE